MNILYVDTDKYKVEEMGAMAQSLKQYLDKDDILLVIPNDCRFVHNASYTELLHIYKIIDEAIREKEREQTEEKYRDL